MRSSLDLDHQLNSFSKRFTTQAKPSDELFTEGVSMNTLDLQINSLLDAL